MSHGNELIDDNHSQSNFNNVNETNLQQIKITDENKCIIDELSYPFMNCLVTPNEIMDNINFTFKFNLYLLEHYIIEHSYNHTNNHQKLYHYSFITTFKDIKSLHDDCHTKYNKYFSMQKFPSSFNETMARRKQMHHYTEEKHECNEYCKTVDIHQELSKMNAYTIINEQLTSIKTDHICKGPGKSWWFGTKRIASKEDQVTLSDVLCKLLNSSSFISTDESDVIFNTLNIDESVKTLIKQKAKTFLCKLVDIARNNVFLEEHDYKKLYEDYKWKYMKFHTVVAITRPLDPKDCKNPNDHWGLQFEGDRFLLKIEYCKTKKIDNNDGVFIIRIQENTCLGQKVCWYSYSKSKNQIFTERWGTLFKIYISKDNISDITAECIGKMLDKWYKEDSEYDKLERNCQHFVRDFIAVFNMNAADYLSEHMTHRQIEKLISPASTIMDQIDSNKRIKYIHAQLKNVWNECMEIKQEEEVNDFDLRQKLNVLNMATYYENFENEGLNTYKQIKYIIDEQKEEMLKDIGIELMCHRKIFLMKILMKNEEEKKCDKFDLREWVERKHLDEYYEILIDQGFADSDEYIMNSLNDKDWTELKKLHKCSDKNRVIMEEQQHTIISNLTDDPIEDSDELQMDAVELLKYWKIPGQYIDSIMTNLRNEEYTDPHEWVDIYDDMEYLMNRIGFTKPHSKKFKRYYTEWLRKKKIHDSQS